MPIHRRALLEASLPMLALAALVPPHRGHAAAARAATVRVGILRFGSVAWEIDVIRTHGLDRAAGLTIETTEFAGTPASQVALQAGSLDMVVQDWLWVSRQRAAGADWTFSPVTSALGAIVAPAASPVRSVADLAGKRLGIAGGPIDKSWLILRAFGTKAFGIDLDQRCDTVFGAPPLILEQLRAGRLDAALTFWPYAARAEATGMRRVLAMEDAIAGLGVSPRTPALGWVYSERWAAAPASGLVPFLHAAKAARSILARSDAEWSRIAPLTGAAGGGELARLRDWYRRGIADRFDSEGAAHLYEILAALGGPALVGAAPHLSPGTFSEADDGAPT